METKSSLRIKATTTTGNTSGISSYDGESSCVKNAKELWLPMYPFTQNSLTSFWPLHPQSVHVTNHQPSISVLLMAEMGSGTCYYKTNQAADFDICVLLYVAKLFSCCVQNEWNDNSAESGNQ